MKAFKIYTFFHIIYYFRNVLRPEVKNIIIEFEPFNWNLKKNTPKPFFDGHITTRVQSYPNMMVLTGFIESAVWNKYSSCDEK